MMSCDLHDYLEIACMYAYPVRLETKQSLSIEGKAKDLVLDQQRRECLLLETGQGVKTLPLESLVSMHVLVENPNFQRVDFQ